MIELNTKKLKGLLATHESQSKSAPMSRAQYMSAFKDLAETKAKCTDFGVMVHKFNYAFCTVCILNKRVAVFVLHTTAEQC